MSSWANITYVTITEFQPQKVTLTKLFFNGTSSQGRVTGKVDFSSRLLNTYQRYGEC